MITCSKTLEFDAGHRVMGHEGLCANGHGHRYAVEIDAHPILGLDAIDRVIDFGVLKAKIGGWINEHWDHAFIVNEKDTAVIAACKDLGWRVFLLPANPTAEGIAEYLLEIVCPELMRGTGVEVHAVTVHETPTCKATASRSF